MISIAPAVAGGLIVVFLVSLKPRSEVPARPNVLFIAVDDLRPELGCYGDGLVKSPNIDRLAASGLLFERAYCQQAVCSPSRTSLLTGLRPDSTRVYDLTTHFRTTVPDVVTLPQHFKNNGYVTAWWGKLYHANLTDPISWTLQGEQMEPKSNWRAYATEASKQIAARHDGAGPAFERAELPDNAYPDGKIAEKAIETLRAIRDKPNAARPFFLAVGFYKPHLPFNAPKKYWDLYQRSDFKLPTRQTPPDDAPALASTGWGELRSYAGIPAQGPLPDEQAQELIHGYHACVSYTDAQIGKVLDELKRLGLEDNTIVVLWGDHGWKLGDYGQWCKHTNFEIDTRVPLMVRVPGMKTAGQKTRALVEMVDLYPFLCDAANLPKPAHLQGDSFAPLLAKPGLAWKESALSQYPRGNDTMGYSLRTDRYRFTKWVKSDGTVVAAELYDLKKDPNSTANVAQKNAYRTLLPKLEAQLAKKRQSAL
ncbi:sulfatase [Persicitalea jodogahamensis]|uniref:sulfatase n=1 Tax=Persicitalea jodogahamensis TaxID=402147 RepID=UPI001E4FFE71|nr:sulfatase [Persicitalea jodogahamensis]